MIAVALKGLAGRKVRALLTAFAVVIGVSMVSGTFILTDTMQKTFDGLFAASYDGTDAVIEGKQIVEKSTSGSATIPQSLLAEVRALPEVAAAGGTVSPAEVNAADIIGRDGKAVAQREPRRRASTAGQRAASARSSSRPAPGPAAREQVVIDAGTADKRALRGRRHGARARRRAGRRAYRLDRHRLVRRRRLARLRQHRGLGPRDRAGAARPRGPLRLDLDRRGGRHVAGRARPRRAAARPEPRSRSRTAPSRRPRTRAQSGQGDGLHPLLPARLRRHRAVRRRVRDLQHAVDHRRPAHARVRDAADARRLAQAGAALGPARGPRDRAARLRHRAVPRVRHRQGHARAVQRAGRRPARRRTPCSRRARSIVSLVLGTGITLLATVVPARRATRVPPIAAVREGSPLPVSRFGARLGPWVVAALVGSSAGRAPRRRRRRRAGRRERGAQPGPDRVDRRRAHDRAHARDAGRRARRRPERVDDRRRSATSCAPATSSTANERCRSAPPRATRWPACRASPPPRTSAPTRRSCGGEETEVTGIDPATIASFYRFAWTKGSDADARRGSAPTARS